MGTLASGPQSGTYEPWRAELYTLHDVVRYSAIPTSTVHRWLTRRADDARAELASFDELISLLFVRRLRALQVPLREIVQAEIDLRERTGHQHPFVHEALWVAGRDVMVRVGGSAEALLSANRRGQLALPGVTEARRVTLPNIVEDVRGELVYGDGRVITWRPTDRIAARPAVQFGLTCVEGTRVTTRAIFDAALAGDMPEDLARLFEVTESDASRAIAWERRLAA